MGKAAAITFGQDAHDGGMARTGKRMARYDSLSQSIGIGFRYFTHYAPPKRCLSLLMKLSCFGAGVLGWTASSRHSLDIS